MILLQSTSCVYLYYILAN